MSALNYLTTLSSKLRLVNQRVAVQLQLNDNDTRQLLTRFIDLQDIDITRTAWLGGNLSLLDAQHYTFKQGQRLLGQEVELLVVDFSQGFDGNSFDANSFNAALGALVGGGILFILNFESLDNSYQTQWLAQHFKRLPCIDNLSADDLSLADVDSIQASAILNRHDQQAEVVAAIEKVVTGHRRRPLVLNANRGRGKTASLGIAAAKLMSQRVMKIVITAPSINALNPLFEFADKTVGQLTWLSQTRTKWHLSNGSTLRFIAPDELNMSDVEADLVLVDEAAALPLPMLQNFVDRFHRLVFSSTIHGYEGCGRGFSIKFMQWLNQHRPGWKHIELTQPIRWAENDPLENWSFETFLLNADDSVGEFNLSTFNFPSNDINAESLELSQVDLSQIELSQVSKQQLIQNAELFRSIFGLLVTAHYQTTPNDVMQVLASDEIQVYQIVYQAMNSLNDSKVIGCLLVSMEGGLDNQLIKDIQLGVRRPKGHLAAAYLTNHLAMNQPAEQTSARIMRIAVDPTWQGYGVGRFALQELQQQLTSVDVASSVDFISVSFGATAELINFWKKSFQLVSIGTRRDHASGCYSAFMVQPLSKRAKHWVEPAALNCLDNFQRVLPLQYQDIEHETLASLWFQPIAKYIPFSLSPMLYNFAFGGNSFESVVPWYSQFVIEYLSQANPFSELTPQQSKADSDGISIVIDKVLLFHSWQAVAAKHKLAGRKQVEQKLREWLKQFTV